MPAKFALLGAMLLTAQLASAAELKSFEQRKHEAYIAEQIKKLPTPFGIRMGSVHPTSEVPISIEDNLKRYEVQPTNPTSLFDKYFVETSTETGRIKKVIAVLNTKDRQKLSDSFKKTVSLMSRKYGSPQEDIENDRWTKYDAVEDYRADISYGWSSREFQLAAHIKHGAYHKIIFSTTIYAAWTDSEPPPQ